MSDMAIYKQFPMTQVREEVKILLVSTRGIVWVSATNYGIGPPRADSPPNWVAPEVNNPDIKGTLWPRRGKLSMSEYSYAVISDLCPYL
jgi:hypothetical protein